MSPVITVKRIAFLWLLAIIAVVLAVTLIVLMTPSASAAPAQSSRPSWCHSITFRHSMSLNDFLSKTGIPPGVEISLVSRCATKADGGLPHRWEHLMDGVFYGDLSADYALPSGTYFWVQR